MSMANPLQRKRILFVGEGVTLAHVARPLELARRMDPEKYDVVMACDPRYERMVRREGLAYQSIHSMASDVFVKRVCAGRALYTADELRAHVDEDIRLIETVRPDVIVGDFRVSLGISAEWAGVPCLTISNVHWSPSVHLPTPVPEHPLVGLVGVRIAGLLIGAVAPFFFKVQSRAFNRVRKEYGLKPLGGRGAHEVYTRGTRTLYADIPELYNVGPLADTESYLGPVNWVPDAPLPEWWGRVPTDRPVVLLTSGSSGSVRGMKGMIRKLAGPDISLIVITAGKFKVESAPEGVFVADFIPASVAVDRADVVVCNGGSAMVYQALAAGKPILGVPQNMDQYYSMEAVVRQGAGRLLRSGMVTGEAMSGGVRHLLADPLYRQAAARLQESIVRHPPVSRLIERLEEVWRIPREAPERGSAGAPVSVAAGMAVGLGA